MTPHEHVRHEVRSLHRKEMKRYADRRWWAVFPLSGAMVCLAAIEWPMGFVIAAPLVIMSMLLWFLHRT